MPQLAERGERGEHREVDGSIPSSVLWVGRQQGLDVRQAREVDAALQDLVANAKVGVRDLAHERRLAMLHSGADIVSRGAVPRCELARPLGGRLVQQRQPKLLDAGLVVPRVDEAVAVGAILQEGSAEDGQSEVKVPEERGDEGVGPDKEDSAGTSDLPVGLCGMGAECGRMSVGMAKRDAEGPPVPAQGIFSLMRLATSTSMRKTGSAGRQSVSSAPRVRPYHKRFQPKAKRRRESGSVSKKV